MVPDWLHVLSIATLVLGAACSLYIVYAVIRNSQQMWIMNVVWPVTALFGTVFTTWAYLRYGRLATKRRAQQSRKSGTDMPATKETPFPMMVAKAALHCGSGCCLGDILAEWLVFAWPAVAVWFGWRSVFSEKMFAVWIVDFLFAFVFGVAFQYFTIAPMRGLGPIQGIWQALKADTLSLSAWQIGMYGFMAIAQFWLFRSILSVQSKADMPEFWCTMQIAMLVGFTTSYPVNWRLIKSGIKEKM